MNATKEMKNRLLALLPERNRESLLRDSIVISFPRGKELYDTAKPMDAVYFPLDCVVSIVVSGGDKSPVEIATIGSEGAAGVVSVLNPTKAIGTTVVQVAGDAVRIGMEAFKEYMRENSAFDKLIHGYLFAFMHQIAQAGACHRLHGIEKRCARWLLMTHDRKGSDTFLLLQGYLAEMLGVRRASVSAAVAPLKAAGLITYVRGQITILDRAGLESVSCPCYRLIRREYEELTLQ
jgi:CRP-like cAMP-binding protein